MMQNPKEPRNSFLSGASLSIHVAEGRVGPINPGWIVLEGQAVPVIQRWLERF
jgi:hypothetical protein